MKRLISLISLLFSLCTFAQTELEYTCEKDGSLSYMKIITATQEKTRDELFRTIEAYFTYNYNDGKSVIQTVNKENYYIIGSGNYSDIAEKTNGLTGRKMKYSVPHIIRIDCKDNRIRVIITVTKYNIRESNWTNENRNIRNYSEWISSTYPIAKPRNENDPSTPEIRQAEIYSSLVDVIETQFGEIENAINTGNSRLENEDW